jgi:hypothetical protein
LRTLLLLEASCPAISGQAAQARRGAADRGRYREKLAKFLTKRC